PRDSVGRILFYVLDFLLNRLALLDVGATVRRRRCSRRRARASLRVGCERAFTAGCARFLARELVRGSCTVRGLAAACRKLAHELRVHRGKPARLARLLRGLERRRGGHLAAASAVVVHQCPPLEGSPARKRCSQELFVVRRGSHWTSWPSCEGGERISTGC